MIALPIGRFGRHRNVISGQVDLSIAPPAYRAVSEWGQSLGSASCRKCIVYVAAGNSATDIHICRVRCNLYIEGHGRRRHDRTDLMFAAGVVKRYLRLSSRGDRDDPGRWST